MTAKTFVTYSGHIGEEIGVWEQKRDSGVVWTMTLTKYTTPSGKSFKYHIYAFAGQAYPVGDFRSLKAALKMLNSFSLYTKKSV